MSIVQPPYLLDFGKVYFDRPPTEVYDDPAQHLEADVKANFGAAPAVSRCSPCANASESGTPTPSQPTSTAASTTPTGTRATSTTRSTKMRLATITESEGRWFASTKSRIFLGVLRALVVHKSRNARSRTPSDSQARSDFLPHYRPPVPHLLVDRRRDVPGVLADAVVGQHVEPPLATGPRAGPASGRGCASTPVSLRIRP